MGRARKSKPRRAKTGPAREMAPPWLRSPLLPGMLIFSLALVVRVIYVLQAQANPQFDAPLMDPAYHDQWAWQLAQGTWAPEGPFFRAPLYTFFLAAIYAIGGHDYLLPRLVQAVLGAGSCVLIYLIGRRLFSENTGRIAGAMAALYWILIYFDNELLIPILFVFLILASFYALLRTLGWERDASQPPRSPAWGFAAGLLLGLAAIARPNILVFVPVVLWLLWRARRRGLRVLVAVTLVLAMLAPIAVVTIYNVTAGDDFVFIASQGGVNFYIGNNPESDGRTAVVPGTRGDWWGGRFDTIKIAERAAGRELKESEVSDYWFGRAFEFIREQPGEWLGLMLRKLGLFWTAVEIGNNSSIPHLRAYAPLMKLPLLGFGLVLPLAVLGVALGWRRRGIAVGVPVAFILLYMAGVVAFFVCARYRVPIVPFLILLAALGLTEAHAAWREGRHRAVLVAVALALAAAVATNLPARAHRENLALAHFHDSIAWKAKGNLQASEMALRQALRLDPNLAEARANLANLLAERGDVEAARRAYEEAIGSDPQNAKTLANLASMYLNRGDLSAAQEALDRALAIDPDHSETLRILGVIRERRGDLAGAREAYERALEFTDERHRIENNLGVLSMNEGRPEEAEKHLRRSVALDPSYAMAWANLGALLVNTGRIPEAVEPLERAAQLEPESAQAWAQLGQVLQVLGRTEEAARALSKARALSQRGVGGPQDPAPSP